MAIELLLHRALFFVHFDQDLAVFLSSKLSVVEFLSWRLSPLCLRGKHKIVLNPNSFHWHHSFIQRMLVFVLAMRFVSPYKLSQRSVLSHEKHDDFRSSQSKELVCAKFSDAGDLKFFAKL